MPIVKFTTKEDLVQQTIALIALLANGVLPSTFPPISFHLLKQELANSPFPTTFEDETLETNGWDWGAWVQFSVNGHPYSAFISGFYGDFSIDHRTNDESEDDE